MIPTNSPGRQISDRESDHQENHNEREESNYDFEPVDFRYAVMVQMIGKQMLDNYLFLDEIPSFNRLSQAVEKKITK